MDANLLDLNEAEAPQLAEGPRWAVDLHMQFGEDEAPTPVDAVSQFLVAILYRDMREMTFTVRDRHSDSEDPTVYVHEGRVYSRVDFDTRPGATTDEAVQQSPRSGSKKPLT
jgi:hypothetical protein